MAPARKVGRRISISSHACVFCPLVPLTKHAPPIFLLYSSQVGLAVVNGQLMAVGGFDGSSYLKTIEIYTPEANTWRMYDGMHYRRLGGGVGVIRLPQT